LFHACYIGRRRRWLQKNEQRRAKRHRQKTPLENALEDKKIENALEDKKKIRR